MDYKELQPKTEHELKHLLSEQETKLCRLRFAVSERQLKNVREIREVRKTVARIQTILRQKEVKA